MGLKKTYTGIFDFLKTNLNDSLSDPYKITDFQFGNGNVTSGNYPLCLVSFAAGSMEPQSTSIWRAHEELYLVFTFNNLGTDDLLDFMDQFLGFFRTNPTFGQADITHTEGADYGWGKDPSGQMGSSGNLLNAVFKFVIETEL